MTLPIHFPGPIHDFPGVRYPNTADGLLAQSDLPSLRRALLYAGSNADDLRNDLFNRARQALVQTASGRRMHLAVFGWPVAVQWQANTQVFPSLGFLPSGDDKFLSSVAIEVWSSAFSPKQKKSLTVLRHCTHLDYLLGLNPLDVRQCVRHGQAIASGKKIESNWTFDAARHKVPVLATDWFPTVYIFLAYVLWDHLGQEPQVEQNLSTQVRTESFFNGLFAPSPELLPNIYVGQPARLDLAIEAGHCMQIRLAAQIARSKGRDAGISIHHDYIRDVAEVKLSASSSEDGDETVINTQVFAGLWRMDRHFQNLIDAVGATRIAGQVNHGAHPFYRLATKYRH